MRFRLPAAVLVLLVAAGPACAVDDSWLVSSQHYDPPDPWRGRSVVILHGFGGSPLDVKPLAEALRESGFRLVIPVLPGETKMTPALDRGEQSVAERVAWLEGLMAAETERFGRKPYLVGFSMGGTVATIAAAAGTAERLVLVSPFYGLPWGDDFLTGLSRFFSPVVPLVPKLWKGKINDPAGYRLYSPGSYTVSLDAFLRLQELAEAARESVASLPPIPTLVIASPDDEVASYEVTAELFGGREGTELVTLPGSDHILFYDYAREEAVRRIRLFLEEEKLPPPPAERR
jgi:carboxylesterase